MVSHRPGGPPEEAAPGGRHGGPNYIVTPPSGECCKCPDSCVSNLQAPESSASVDFEYFDPLFSFGATCSTKTHLRGSEYFPSTVARFENLLVPK